MCAALTAPALAGPPLVTDDPDTPGKGRFELNLAYTLDLSAQQGGTGHTWEHAAPLVDFNYGIGERDQVKLEIPLEILDPAGDGARIGLGDALLGYKIRFLDEAKAWVSVSFYPQLGIPTGDSGRGFGIGSPSLLLPIQVGRHFLADKLYVYGDLGYEKQFTGEESDTWSGGLAVEYSLTARWILCGEVRYEHRLRVESGSIDDGLFNLGAKYELSERVSLMGAVGRSFNPRPDGGSNLLGYFGVQLSF